MLLCYAWHRGPCRSLQCRGCQTWLRYEQRWAVWDSFPVPISGSAKQRSLIAKEKGCTDLYNKGLLMFAQTFSSASAQRCLLSAADRDCLAGTPFALTMIFRLPMKCARASKAPMCSWTKSTEPILSYMLAWLVTRGRRHVPCKCTHRIP